MHTQTGRAAAAREELVALVEIGALCGLAVAQPLLDITGRSPDFFLFHGADHVDILLLVAAITVGPPVLLWGLGALTRLVGRRVRRAVHLLTVGALCAALAVETGKWLLPVRGMPLALLAAAVALAAALSYLRWSATARMLRLAAVGPLVFVLLFVFASPSSSLVLAGVAGPRDGAAPAPPDGAAPGPRGTGSHPPLVVIFFDELPQLSLLDSAGRIDATRFPHFARLAADSTWYRNATTVRGFTPYAVPSMLTGRFPTRKAAPHYTQYPNNLFTALGGVYDIRAQESVVNLCPPEHCARARRPARALPRLLGESAALFGRVLSVTDAEADPTDGFAEPVGGQADAGTPVRRPDDGVATFRWARMRDNQPERFTAFLADLRPADRPTLYFLHLLLPHKPFRYLPSGARYPVPTGLPDGGPWWGQLNRQRHLLQARYADRLLGLALDAMARSGLYDDAVVAVTADHGIAFTTQRSYRRNLSSAQLGAAEIGWVPLFIKAPGQRTGRTDHRNWLHVDLLPTLADHAGVAVPWRVDGVSALGPPRTSTAKPFTWDHKRPLMLDPRLSSVVLAGPDDAVDLPGPPRPDLVGAAVRRLPVTEAGGVARVPALPSFRAVDPAGGTVPAVVTGSLPTQVPAGRHLAIAVNGRIGTVVPVLPVVGRQPRFAGVLPEAALFRPGANRLELFLIAADGRTLQRLRLTA